ncbi:hypothetical protein [Kutzneria albida]|uniref:FAD-binding domain-containing protein n=1 Tax=Kutzneria albida DSM 43870 TaxID=1449976 RepID=W5WFC9_9PSEU|nr:hypothetical protein [Kutzneria albida]AHH99552.1 hypothetical protein KALB_6192 [Kutzneria albida DSM 43870]
MSRTCTALPGSALAAYDSARRGVTQKLARMSLSVNRMAHARRFLWARDLAVRGAMRFGELPA